MPRRDDVTSFLQQPASLFDQHVVSKFMTIRPKVLGVKDFHLKKKKKIWYMLILIRGKWGSRSCLYIFKVLEISIGRMIVLTIWTGFLYLLWSCLIVSIW